MLAAVVYISEFKENASNAVKSVLGARDCFSELHVIGQAEGVQLYDGWDEDREKLGDVQVKFAPKLDAKNVDADYVVEIPPHCHVSHAGIVRLQQEAKYSSREQTHFSLAAGIKLGGASLWLGFMVVIAFISSVWYRLQMRAIIQKGKHRYVAERPVYMRYWRAPEVRQRVVPEDMSTAVVEPRTSPFRFLWWTLRTHKHLTLWWLWIVPMPKLWMWFFAGYWGLAVVTCADLLMRLVGRSYVAGFVTMIFAGFWVLNWIAALYTTSCFYKFRWLLPLSLALPVYVVAFPFIMLYTWLIKPKSW